MSRFKPVVVIVALALLLGAVPTWAEKGRVFDPDGRMRMTFLIGDRSPIGGGVNETNRAINELRDNPDAPESFTFQELGLTESTKTFGLSIEYQWKWVTLFVDTTYMEAQADGIAPRDLFIGVDEVFYDGQSYDYQVIEQGSAYTGDLDIWVLNPRVAFTPVTVNPGGATQFVPWVLVGLFTLGGNVDVDAGPARGTELYENPVRTYVQGGKSSGSAAAFAPEIGLGGELKFRVGNRSRLSFQGNYSIFEFKGSTGDLGVSSRNEKNVDVDYTALDAKVFYELPLRGTSNFVIGASFRNVEVNALSSAIPKPEDEILELREKFDKDIDLEIETFVINLGFRW